MSEAALRERMTVLARSLFERGYSVGTAGNVGAAVHDGLLMRPTNSSLGELDPRAHLQARPGRPSRRW